jgi:hypothetical protein
MFWIFSGQQQAISVEAKVRFQPRVAAVDTATETKQHRCFQGKNSGREPGERRTLETFIAGGAYRNR